MAKKGNRVQVILECTEHKASGLAGTSRYITKKNKKNTPERMELKKFNPILKKVTVHKEIKQLIILSYCIQLIGIKQINNKNAIMAKAAKTAIKTKDQKAAADAKNWTKVIRALRSPKSGAYTFKEAMVHKDKIKDHLS